MHGEEASQATTGSHMGANADRRVRCDSFVRNVAWLHSTLPGRSSRSYVLQCGNFGWFRSSCSPAPPVEVGIRQMATGSGRQTVLALLLLSVRCQAAKILGLAWHSCLSHQLNVLTVGRHLADRGHHFTFLMVRPCAVLVVLHAAGHLAEHHGAREMQKLLAKLLFRAIGGPCAGC